MNYFLIFILGLVLSTTACERVKEEASVQPPPLGAQVEPGTGEAAPQQVPTVSSTPSSINVANLILQPKAGTPVTLAVEVAGTPDERRQGLMGRENLGERQGMWFVFEDDVQDPFWMKDTPVSLDIIFVDKDYKVVDIIANTTPNSELLLVPRQKYRYVLEVKAGTAALHKLMVGDKVEFRLGPP